MFGMKVSCQFPFSGCTYMLCVCMYVCVCVLCVSMCVCVYLRPYSPLTVLSVHIHKFCVQYALFTFLVMYTFLRLPLLLGEKAFTLPSPSCIAALL